MNSVHLLGRLVKDPTTRYTSGNNTATTNFTLAVPRRFAQDWQPQADFINIITWAKTAEFCGKYFQKGQQVAVVGRIQTRTWDDNEGKRHFVTEVVADEAYFADSKREGQQNNVSTAKNAEDFIDQFNGAGGFKVDNQDGEEICEGCHLPMSKCECLPF